MIGDIGVHGADDAEVVGAGGDVREDVGDFETALAVALEFVGRPHERAGFAFGAEVFAWHGLAVEAVEFRFGVEGVNLGGAAVGEDVDDVFGFAAELGGVGDERVGRGGFCGGEEGLGGDGTEAHAAALEEVASGGEEVAVVGRVVMLHGLWEGTRAKGGPCGGCGGRDVGGIWGFGNTADMKADLGVIEGWLDAGGGGGDEVGGEGDGLGERWILDDEVRGKCEERAGRA